MASDRQPFGHPIDKKLAQLPPHLSVSSMSPSVRFFVFPQLDEFEEPSVKQQNFPACSDSDDRSDITEKKRRRIPTLKALPFANGNGWGKSYSSTSFLAGDSSMDSAMPKRSKKRNLSKKISSSSVTVYDVSRTALTSVFIPLENLNVTQLPLSITLSPESIGSTTRFEDCEKIVAIGKADYEARLVASTGSSDGQKGVESKPKLNSKGKTKSKQCEFFCFFCFSSEKETTTEHHIRFLNPQVGS